MKRPNILVLVADQHRGDCIGYAGEYPVLTPQLDRLAAEGVAFRHAYTPIPTCCPARQAFYGCRRPESFGGYWNYGITMPVGSLSPEEYCFVRDFSAAGYRTVHLGGWECSPDHPATEYGFAAQVYLDYHGDTGYAVKGPITGWEDTAPRDKTLTAYTADRILQTVEELAAGDEPFFMVANFAQPHPPCHPHPDFLALYGEVPPWAGSTDTLADKPYIQRQMVKNWGNEGKTWEDWEPVARRYYAAISEIDFHVGRVLDRLDALGIGDDTVVVYTADHGDTCGDHGMFDKHYVLYDDVCRVPLIMRWRGHFSPHVTDSFTTHALDLGKTLLDLADVPCTGENLHGKSLLPVLSGGDSPRDAAVSTFNGAQFGLCTMRSVVTDRYRYVWSTGDVDELYDHETDPGERHNLVADPGYAAVLCDLRRRLFDTLIAEDDTLCTLGGGSWVAKPHLLDGKKG